MSDEGVGEREKVVVAVGSRGYVTNAVLYISASRRIEKIRDFLFLAENAWRGRAEIITTHTNINEGVCNMKDYDSKLVCAGQFALWGSGRGVTTVTGGVRSGLRISNDELAFQVHRKALIRVSLLLLPTFTPRYLEALAYYTRSAGFTNVTESQSWS